MKRTLIIFLSFFWLGNLSSQNWVNMIDSMPNSYTNFKAGVVDHNTNIMYLGGLFQQVNNLKTKAIIRYDGVKFDTLGAGLDPQWAGLFTPTDVRTAIMFQNKLYVGGQFERAGKYKSPYLARWNGSDWDTVNFNPNNPIQNMEVHNNELYVCGSFDTIGGIEAKNIAKFDGTNWHSLNFPFDDLISDIAIFQDTIYAAGSFYQSGFSVLAKYNGTTWVPWRGVTGDANKGIWGIKTIDSMLYVYGRYWGIDGKTGNGLMAYNGKTWFSLGGGVTPTSYCYISDIAKINNEFYISGNFEFIDGITNNNGLLNYNTNMAKFDGDRWCTYLPPTRLPTFFTIEYNNETYIAGAFDTVGTSSALPLIKFTGGNSTITCGNSVGVGLKEITISDHIKIYPNPTTSLINITDEQNDLTNTNIQITNTIGETVILTPFQNEIDLSQLSAGIYFLTIQSNSQKKTIKIIKN